MITNALNLPAPLVAAIAADPYDNGGADASVTTLLKPPRMVALEAQHRDSLVEDASERIWALIGRLGHAILAAAADNEIAHHRLFTECLGWKISGELDILHGSVISDYKFVSAWSVKDGPKEEWEQQINLYKLLCEENGITGINLLEIVAVLRDWSKLEARRDRNYPQHGVMVFRLPMWRTDFARGWMTERVRLHQEARKELPQCTPEEMWERPTKYAVKKEGRKSALRVLDSMDALEKWTVSEGLFKNGTLTKGISIEERPGERVRCSSYCAVGANGLCEQYNNYRKEHEQSNQIEG